MHLYFMGLSKVVAVHIRYGWAIEWGLLLHLDEGYQISEIRYIKHLLWQNIWYIYQVPQCIIDISWCYSSVQLYKLSDTINDYFIVCLLTNWFISQPLYSYHLPCIGNNYTYTNKTKQVPWKTMHYRQLSNPFKVSFIWWF